MLGRTHALSGAVAFLAAGTVAMHLDAGHLAAGTALAAGAAVLPDIDHPDATIARTFGVVTEVFAWLVEKISGGHRHGTHSLAGIAAFTTATVVAATWQHTLAGMIGLGVLITLSGAALLRALKIGGHAADLIAVAAAVAIVHTGYGVALLPMAVALGTAAHLAGDMLTDEGCPLAWPLSRRYLRLLPRPLAFTTGAGGERWVVVPLLLAALAWLIVTRTGAAHLLLQPGAAA